MWKIAVAGVFTVVFTWLLVMYLKKDRLKNILPRHRSGGLVSKEPAPCGDDKIHYWWVSQDWPCPVCCRAHDTFAKRNEREAHADLVASKVVEQLRKNGGL